MTFSAGADFPLHALQFLTELGATEALEEESGSFLRPATTTYYPGDNQKAGNPAPLLSAAPQTSTTHTAAHHSGGATTKAKAKPQPTGTSLAQAIAKASALADAASDLASLKEAILNFEDCPLKNTASNTVFARGNPNSRIMLIGEAPGAEEDRQGIPFCGPSGKLLDKMLRHIGLKSEDDYYISNSIFWRPPGNRQPTPDEIATCRPFVKKHISLASPSLIVLVGGVATKALLERPEGITRLRGKRIEYENDYMKQAIPAYAIFHPSYLLRQPMAKKATWQDLLAISVALSG